MLRKASVEELAIRLLPVIVVTLSRRREYSVKDVLISDRLERQPTRSESRLRANELKTGAGRSIYKKEESAAQMHSNSVPNL